MHFEKIFFSSFLFRLYLFTFLSVFVFSISISCNNISFSNAVKNKYCNLNNEVDYIVVGVGTAGALVAKRLSDDLKTSVLALSKGKNLSQTPLIKFSDNTKITVPAGLLGLPNLYQTGLTVPQVFADDNQLTWVLAVLAGGASSINAGVYMRQTNYINAQWEKLLGRTWSIERITRLYKELETYNGKTTNPAVRGFHGPLQVRQVPNPGVVSQKFTQAIVDATGFDRVLDYNDPQTPIGPSPQLQFTQSGAHGEFRVSSATTFLNESVMTPDGNGVNGRKLKVLFEAPALRTLWSGNKATGVEFMHNGVKQKVMAKKGVIVCAGLYSSSFLMHSGIGPKNLLRSLNIPVIFDNANVGQQLADQNFLLLLFTSDPKDAQVVPTAGIYTQLTTLPDPVGDQSIRAFHFAVSNLINVPGLTLGLLDLCNPKSRGSITIDSPDALKRPVINLGVFSNNEDLELFVRGFQVYIKNINAQLQKYKNYTLIYPDPAIIDDVPLLKEFIKNNVISYQCFQSHCRMADFKQGGVVNEFGQAHGVEKFFVADDSVVPIAMDGTPMASAYLLAAGIVEFILNGKKA